MADWDWANAIANRINCYGIQKWLGHFAAWLGQADAFIFADTPLVRKEMAFPSRGLKLTVYNLNQPGNPEQVVLERAEFDPFTSFLPFGLDALHETPMQANGRLSPLGTAQNGQRVSYFREKAQVVELTFKPGMVGLERVLIVRLGGPLDCGKELPNLR